MKQIFLICALSLIIGNVFSQKSEITFKTESHDFGTIKEIDGIKDFKFELTNTGQAPLMILKVKPSCGCTSTDYTKQPILPGKSGYIIASYNPKGRPGKFNKTITVTTNAENPTKIISFSGSVIPMEKGLDELYPVSFNGVKFQSRDLMLMKVKNTEILSDTFGIYNASEKPAKVTFSNMPAHIKIKAYPEVLKPQQKGYIKLEFDGGKSGEWGYTREQVSVVINDEEIKDNKVTVSTTVVEDFTKLTPAEIEKAPKLNIAEKTHDFGEVKQGEKTKYTFEFTNDGKSDLLIRKIKSNYSYVTAKLDKTKIKPGEKGSIAVEFDTKGKRGKQSCNITLISNDPLKSSTLLLVKSQVVE